MLMAIANGTAQAIGPACLLQHRLTLLLGTIEPLTFRQRKPFSNSVLPRTTNALISIFYLMVGAWLGSYDQPGVLWTGGL